VAAGRISRRRNPPSQRQHHSARCRCKTEASCQCSNGELRCANPPYGLRASIDPQAVKWQKTKSRSSRQRRILFPCCPLWKLSSLFDIRKLACLLQADLKIICLMSTYLILDEQLTLTRWEIRCIFFLTPLCKSKCGMSRRKAAGFSLQSISWRIQIASSCALVDGTATTSSYAG